MDRAEIGAPMAVKWRFIRGYVVLTRPYNYWTLLKIGRLETQEAPPGFK